MSHLDFGDYAIIEQKRHGVPNEQYVHKVIGRLRGNCWVDVPVQTPAKETIHAEMVDLVACVCCGVMEREVLHYRECDAVPRTAPNTANQPRDAAPTMMEPR